MNKITERANNYVATHENIKLISFVVLTGITIGVWITTGKLMLSALLFSPILIYLCIEKPFIFPFGLYALLIPFDQVLSITSSGATLTMFLGALSIIVFLFKGTFERKLRWPGNATLGWILFLIYSELSSLWGIQQNSPLFSGMSTTIGLAGLYLIAVSYKSQEGDFNTLKSCIFIGGLFGAIYLVYNFAIGHEYGTDVRYTMKISNRSTDPNLFAFSLLVSISICIQMILENKKKAMKLIFIAALSIMLFSVIITGSRGGLLGIGAIISIYVLSIKQRITYTTVLIVIGIILMSLTPNFFIERWTGAVGEGGAGRSTIWYVGLQALKEYWAFGAGQGNFAIAYGNFAFHDVSKGWYRGAHNIYLELLVEFGIVGFSLVILTIGKHYQAIQTRFLRYKMNSIMLKASFWGILVSSFFLGTFWSKSFWLLWMIIMIHKNVMEKEHSY